MRSWERVAGQSRREQARRGTAVKSSSSLAMPVTGQHTGTLSAGPHGAGGKEQPSNCARGASYPLSPHRKGLILDYGNQRRVSPSSERALHGIQCKMQLFPSLGQPQLADTEWDLLLHTSPWTTPAPAPWCSPGPEGCLAAATERDNWAFLYAQRLALKQELPLHVCFCLVPKFLGATIRHYRFMLRGLQEVAEECAELNIPFHLLLGYAKDVLPTFVVEHGVGGLVTDFSPLRLPRQWVEDVKERLPEDVPFAQVDAHNIVPCWVASPKQEYSARTIRGKIHAQLPEFLTEFPPVVPHPHLPSCPAEPIAWEACYSSLQVDHTVKEVEWATPGTAAGMAVLKSFIAERLKSFSTHRNDPNKAALSNLSPWLHFGQVSTQRAILEVQKQRRNYKDSVDAFVEEAVVRRELAENFCYYNENYDSVQGAYDWAQTTLKLHAKDKRPYLYSLQELEQGTTHDPLWNAAQLQMVQEGKMHGFLRMYWAKKILEWTRSPEEALQFAIYLNDRYELDGRDPNGYVGCLWSICGIHDQGWAERPIFGKIRYMNYAGCKRKFDVDQFERRYTPTHSQ
uniref:Deoxyribodipyrimidine photo-lyase n=1 Tax=Taeniopygia guttata TaxID=59729 RepID=H0ZH35_TAEGU